MTTINQVNGKDWEETTTINGVTSSEILLINGFAFLEKGVTGYWNFDEGENTTANDLIGSNDGTLSEVTWDTGKISNCIEYDKNETEQVTTFVSNFLPTDETDFTISLWVSKYGGFSSPVSRVILQEESWSEITGYHGLRVLGSDDGILVVINNTTRLTKNFTWGVDSFHHLVLTYDQVSYKLYIDNVKVDEYTSSTYPSFTTAVSSLGNNYTQGLEMNWGGRIDELGVWDRCLSVPEISIVYNGGSGKTYPF